MTNPNLCQALDYLIDAIDRTTPAAAVLTAMVAADALGIDISSALRAAACKRLDPAMEQAVTDYIRQECDGGQLNAVGY